MGLMLGLWVQRCGCRVGRGKDRRRTKVLPSDRWLLNKVDLKVTNLDLDLWVWRCP